MKRIVAILILLGTLPAAFAGNGYDLWLNYRPVKEAALLGEYRRWCPSIVMPGEGPTMQAIRYELGKALPSLLSVTPSFRKNATAAPAVVIARYDQLKKILPGVQTGTPVSSKEGYRICMKVHKGVSYLVITGPSDISLLYGAFHLLRHIGGGRPLKGLDITESPALDVRVLNHWDNLDRYVERGYAGGSIWNWHTLPGYLDPRYTDYARANASIGINGTVLTNVNANALVLSAEYIEKVKALAEVFRPYGIKVYLTARFSAPMELGKLPTADPLDPAVRRWWKSKVEEICRAIPDFGGFLVKANSEGQPGPQNYGRTHADGANMLAEALAPFNGIVMWRAFVYSNEVPDDRVKQAYNEFRPLNGRFLKNVLVQVKNGPLDFQPREPFHPLFGAMPQTQLMMEFQLTQEYLGFATHLVYLPLLQQEVLSSNTFAGGRPSPVREVLTTRVNDSSVTGMAGVANIGSDVNWCGHPFAQANWYAFGRMAWNPSADPEQIAKEWIRQTFSLRNREAEGTILRMMMRSYDAVVRYMTPLGLTHIMGNGHHYGPAPWSDDLPRADWNPVYYHRADSNGIGFSRTEEGSNAIAQYDPSVRKRWMDPRSGEESLLLWFHHLPWNFRMQDGNTLWNNLCLQYQQGVNGVRKMQADWNSIAPEMDPVLFRQVQQLLAIQEKEAVWWKNACILYFQTFSRMPLPEGVEKPDHTLEHYKKLRFPYAPGNG